MNYRAFLNTVGARTYSLPIVILYVTAGCNLHCITCSYREPLPNELTLDEYREIFRQLKLHGLRRVVYSGGEPLMRRDLPDICTLAAKTGAHQSLLTNGLLLEKRANEVLPFLDEVIVSLDGPDAETHNAIRGLDCFDRILRGVEFVKRSSPVPSISFRCVVQRRNFRTLDEMVELGMRLGVDRISFLAADVETNAFHRDQSGYSAPTGEILLDPGECAEFRESVKALIQRRTKEFASRFIAESPQKIMHLVEYFEAHQGLSPFPRNECNAPSVSMVIKSTGEVLPCYFLPSYGSLRTSPLSQLLNASDIVATRNDVKAYRLKECQRCVCTLKVRPFSALMDAF